ncbi:hypothetical protein [Streptomyces sp. NPDC053367]|uniref:hypothetical protein n=1 Tax=Streptomyces sp. NPDC053367 TaxID=3365700 RepID=UPI0037D381C0
MRRTARLMTGAALAAAAVSGPLTASVHAAGSAGLEVRPSSAVPGGSVTVGTRACGADATADGDASAVGAGHFTLAPGSRDGEVTGRFEVPPSAQPGTYEIVAACVRGGREVRGDLVVTLTAVQPRGSVKTGVGGALGPDPVQTAAGVAALAVAAAGGTWLLHRRARGDGI